VRVPPREPGWEHGDKALRTRQLILDTAQRLFLARGYGGTRIEHITNACEISRAGFYTYFRSKLEVFDALGTTTYKRNKAVIARFADLPTPCSLDDVRGWVEEYFGYMAEHGAFLLSSGQAGPDDVDFHARVLELNTRSARRLGTLIQQRRGRAGGEVAIGLTAMAMLERGWFFSHGMHLPVDDEELLDAAAHTLHGLLRTS
jgi:TetR/AcrR family transcriptional regulator